MGKMRDYICPGCGYTAEVCGGTECGMRTCLTTYSCPDCKILFDASITDLAGDFDKYLVMDVEEKRKLKPVCPKCKTEKITPWVKENPVCPACGAMMEPGIIMTLWD